MNTWCTLAFDVPQHTTLTSDLSLACTGTWTFPRRRQTSAAWEGVAGQLGITTTSSRWTRRGTCTASNVLHRPVARLFPKSTCRSLLAPGITRRLWCRHVSRVQGGRSGRNPSEGGRDLGQIRTDVSRSIETSWGRYRSEGEPIDTFRRTRGHPRFRPGWVRFQTGSFRVRTGFGSEQTGETRFEGRLRGATVPFPVRFNGGLRPRTTGHFPSGERVHKS